MKSAIYSGLFNPYTSLSDYAPLCSSGNCTWPSYTSLAICAYVADVSQYIQKHTYSLSGFNETTFYTIPNGGLLATGYQNLTLHPTDNAAYSTLAFQNSQFLFNFYTFLYSNQTGTPLLLESSFQLCAHTLNTTVTNGQTSTVEISRFTEVNRTGDPYYSIFVPGDNTSYIMGDYSHSTLATFLATMFNGNYTVTPPNPTIKYDTDAVQMMVDTLLFPPYDQNAMAVFLNGFATSMTNA